LCIIAQHFMSEFEKKKIEMELKAFTTNNFERPNACRNPEQVRFYIHELCSKIEELRNSFNYVPDSAYALLAQYTARQNSFVYKEFVSSY
jgi:hypothetical protein